MTLKINSVLTLVSFVCLAGCGQQTVTTADKSTNPPTKVALNASQMPTSVKSPVSPTPGAAKTVEVKPKGDSQEVDLLGNKIFNDKISGPGADAAIDLATLDEHTGMEDHILALKTQINRICMECKCKPIDVAHYAKEAQSQLKKNNVTVKYEAMLPEVRGNKSSTSKTPIIEAFGQYVTSKTNIATYGQNQSQTDTSSVLFK